MVLIVAFSLGDAKATSLAEHGADAVLISSEKLNGVRLEQIVDSLSEVPWGISAKEVSAEELPHLREMGCDFLVFDATKAPPALLREEEMAKIVEIQPSMADGLARAIESMPIDAALIGAEGGLSPTIYHLMTYQHVANLVRKPLVVSVPTYVTSEDLEELLAVGVAGVVVNLERGLKSNLVRLRQAIGALPPSKGRKGKAEPLLPHIGESRAIELQEEEEES